MNRELLSMPLIIVLTLSAAVCTGMILGMNLPRTKTSECHKEYIECAQRCQEIHEISSDPIAGWGVIEFSDACICGVALD